MGTDIFGISVSALNTAQMGLATTEHNIANANTPGYNRQVNVQVARPAQLSGSGFVGQGADIGLVKRMYDEFLSNQVIGEQGQAAHLNSYYAQIQQINNMVADPNAGLSPALQGFFSAVNDVANAPDSAPARQTLLSSAQTLASRFQAMNQRLVDINDSINGQIRASVTNINGYAQQIATLNRNIVAVQAASAGKPANDLLDQRDQLITQLNQEVKVNIVKQGDGSLNLSLGNGQLLVLGEQAYSVQAVNSLSDPSKLEIAAVSGKSIIRLQQSSIQGGTLGGLLAFRSQSLDQAQNTLGLVAMGLAGTFNQQHQLGQDLKGALGDNFFANAQPVVYSNTANAAPPAVLVPGAIGANIASAADYAALTGSDYSLVYSATGYTLTRLSDNTILFANQAALPAAPVDGLTLSVSAAPAVGDQFLVRPTVNGAGNIAVAITDPAKIAAATPIRTVSGTISPAGIITDNNNGTGKISAGTVNLPPPGTPDPLHLKTDLNLRQPVTITFTSPTAFTVTGVGVPSSPLAGVPYTPGANITYNGWTTQITGAPVAGDTFTVGPDTAGASTDNRNALLLASLQTTKTLYSNTVNYQGAYSQMVSQIGSKTRELEVSTTAQDAMVAQTVQAQQGVSGVNLDEEAANLMRYQRAYQAAGKAMQIANTLFDTLISLGK